MQYVGKVFSTVSQLYKELNPATLSGAIDVVVVEDKDGELSCSPFHVRFGKLQLLRPSDKAVQIIVNEKQADFYMKVGDSGEGFFVLETEHDVPSQFATSPVASPSLSFKSDDADPDFLDLGGHIDPLAEQNKDGYVSAPSAHESEEDDGADDDDDDDDDTLEKKRRISLLENQWFSNSFSSSHKMPERGGKRSLTDLVQFKDDMALGALQSERLLHQLNNETSPSTVDDFRPRSSTLFTPLSSEVKDAPSGSTRQFKRSANRPLSVVSDSDYLLSNAFTKGQPSTESIDSHAKTKSTDQEGQAGEKDSDGLHTSWDWGVKPSPTTEVKPKPLPVVKPTTLDVDSLLHTQPEKLQLSLCGIGSLYSAVDGPFQERVFEGARVDVAKFAADPMGILSDPNLVFKIGKTYAQGESLISSLVSKLAFGKPLENMFMESQSLGDDANVVVMTESKSDEFLNSTSTLSTSGNLPQELTIKATTAGVGDSTTSKDNSIDQAGGRRWWNWGQRSVSTQDIKPETSMSTLPADAVAVNVPPEMVKEQEMVSNNHIPPPSPTTLEEGAGYMSDDGKMAHPMRAQIESEHMHYAKTLRMTSEQLKSLDLKYGANDIKFQVPSNKAYCEARIFLYKHDTQVVISDIDGTITKSDALGHLFNMVGKDWTHHGVAKLYTDIASNGYEILYLTSRAIGQADGTRYFLSNVKQGDYKLPLGPLLLSPDRLFTSFHREVIMRRPHEFKMACLRDIKNLFGDISPFYAGFGNRITDAMSYRSVNVPVSRICTIDTYGEIKLDLLPGYKSSYVKMNDLVDMMFPALSSKLDPKFNDWEYWKPKMPSIEDELAEIDAQLELEKKQMEEAAAAAKKKTNSNKQPDQNLTDLRLPANAVAINMTDNDSKPSLFTRATRAMSNTGGSVSGLSSSPPTPPRMSDFDNPRQRAESWVTTTPPPSSSYLTQSAFSAVTAAEYVYGGGNNIIQQARPSSSQQQMPSLPIYRFQRSNTAMRIAEESRRPSSSKDTFPELLGTSPSSAHPHSFDDAASNEFSIKSFNFNVTSRSQPVADQEESQTREYDDVDSDMEDEDEDDDEIDQEMLDIMRDMEQVKRL